MTIGDRIKELRERRQLTQEELAKTIRTTKQTIYKYENNIITNIPSDKIETLAKVLNASPAYLMGWTDDINDNGSDMDKLAYKNMLEKGIDYKEKEPNAGSALRSLVEKTIEKTLEERILIDRYMNLDEKGKHTVDTVLEMEYNRCNKPHLMPVAAHNDDNSEEEREKMRRDLEDL